jgi:hypothetical protein
MAVVACMETARGTGVSGKFGESFTFTRRWVIRCDSPTTSRVAIARAANVQFGSPHPDAPSHLAMEFDCTEESGDGMAWALVVKYYVPPFENRPDDATGLPKDSWSGSGSTTTIPVFKDKDGDMITNSAGDPLEGGERESTEAVLNLTKCYPDMSWSSIARNQTNTVNNASWNGSAARTWKASFKGAQKKEQTVSSSGTATLVFWEVTWEFHYREETWDWTPWDVGFNQLVTSDGTPSASGSSRAAILGADKKAVKSPVALAGGVAKGAGQKPDALQFKIYKESSFSVFGNPS